MQRVIDEWSIVRARWQTIAVKDHLQLLVHEPRPRKFKGPDLEHDAHIGVGVEFFLSKRSQLPTTARQMLQNAATSQALKNLPNGRPADPVFIGSSFLAK